MTKINSTVTRNLNTVPIENKSKYRLQVTAGPGYDTAYHTIVPVNQQETVTFENDCAMVSLCVRIKNYTGK